jgi:spermidine synthase
VVQGAQETKSSHVAVLGLVCFASGAAALIFEGLWFHLAGLALGNSVWASSIVTASFMAGLALGGGLAAVRGGRLRNPLRAYALLELSVGAAGIAVVFLLPLVTPGLAPALSAFVDRPAALNAARLAVALLLMLIPATAMGATLPVVVSSVARGQVAFGRALGWLYGWNTLGGVVGVLAGELVLIERLGIRGTSLAAGTLNLLAALACLRLSRDRTLESAPDDAPDNRPPTRWLAAAFLCGAALLALEVVWFRFLVLFLFGTTLTFAVMLAVILAGIGLGGLAASWWLRIDPEADAWFPCLAVISGIVTMASYAAFQPYKASFQFPTYGAFLSAIRLMMPGALVSGLLFSLLGNAVRRRARDNSHAAGSLTLANTAGAMTGALLAGFVLLPILGIDVSLFATSATYIVTALCASALARTARARYAVWGTSALWLLLAAFFPFGLVRALYLKPWIDLGGDIVAFREGLNETIAYARINWAGGAHHYRLLTNNFSMSSTNYHARRYQNLYVYWAMAVHPEAERALLICYGVGNTAHALVETPTLASIDVVDISRDVLSLSGIPYPPPARSPLTDPRVTVHVEDGRFFLLTTSRRWDLITAEPPPPKHAGVVNLYSREYFTLIHDHLSEGGVTTYWLPVEQLQLRETRSIVQGFCAAFPDCSLWVGSGANWMLAGTRNGRPPTPSGFERQWKDARVGSEMRGVGFDVPELLGAAFMADHVQLREWLDHAKPLTDNWPRRVGSTEPDNQDLAAYKAFLDPKACRARFEASTWIRELWPAEWRERTLDFFVYRDWMDNALSVPDRPATLRRILHDTNLSMLPLLLMGVDPDRLAVARQAHEAGARFATTEMLIGQDALANRRYAEAHAFLAAALALDPSLPEAKTYLDLANELQKQTH